MNADPQIRADQVSKYPPTRFMGSKEKLLGNIRCVADRFEFDSVADLFSGSGVVAYLFKSMGKRVFANDHMSMCATFSRAMVENNSLRLNEAEVDRLFRDNPNADDFVQRTFPGLYFSDSDNALIDRVRANARRLRHSHKRAIAMSALMRACVKKRARGIFTYTGHRYDDGRCDLRLSLENHIRNALSLVNGAVFDNGRVNAVRRGNAMTARFEADMFYLDPPYYSPLSDNEYVRRYHFVEGLARGWKGVDIQWHTKTRKFRSYDTPFRTRAGAADAFDRLFQRLRGGIILLSYSSNSLPTRDEITALLGNHNRNVEVIDVDHRYSFANQGWKVDSIKNGVKEYLFVGY